MKIKFILQQSRTLRFLLAGGINTLFGFTAYSILIVSGVVVWIAVFLGMLAGTAFNFLTTGGYVFRDMSLHRLPLFLFFYFAVFAINLVLIECQQNLAASPDFTASGHHLLFFDESLRIQKHKPLRLI
jgi:putative flippase GtrA